MSEIKNYYYYYYYYKQSIFIGQVNKLCANFGCLQMSVLVRLFKSYWGTFYGSQM